MQTQEIVGVKLTLKSEEGIKPMMQYNGLGRLNSNSTGFHFTEKKKVTRVKNIRVAKLCDGVFIMYEVKTGRFKLQMMLNEDEMTQKAIIEKWKPMIEEAKEGGWLK